MGLKPQLRQAFNNRMNRLGVATAGLGLFSIALAAAGSFLLVCAWGFCQGFCGGAIDTIGNAGISDVHGTGAAPWMQALHFCFSIGALVAPATVGQLGYRKVFVAFGLLAMPASLACCLAHGGGGNTDSSSDWALVGGQGQGMLLQEEAGETTYSTDSTASFKSDTEMMVIEAVRRPSGGSPVSRTQQCCQLQEDPTAISPASTGLTTPTKKPTAHGREGQGSKPPGTLATTPTLDDESQAKQLGESTEATHMSSYASPPCWNKDVDGDVLVPQLFRLSETALLPHGAAGEGKVPPVLLIALLAFFCFLYVGAEVGFGGWVAVVVLRDGLSGEAGAVRMASLFWGGITVGRLLAVPLAVRFSNGFLISANLLGGLLSSLLLLLVGRISYSWAALGVGLLGLSMASTFPLAMSLLPSAGFILSGKNSSRMVVGGALGDMLMPALIAALLGPDDGVWPAALYVVCVVISVLLLLVYGTCCVLLKGAGRRFGKGEGGL